MSQLLVLLPLYQIWTIPDNHNKKTFFLCFIIQPKWYQIAVLLYKLYLKRGVQGHGKPWIHGVFRTTRTIGGRFVAFTNLSAPTLLCVGPKIFCVYYSLLFAKLFHLYIFAGGNKDPDILLGVGFSLPLFF